MYIHLGEVYVEVTYSFGGQRTGIELAKAEEAVLERGLTLDLQENEEEKRGRWRKLDVKE